MPLILNEVQFQNVQKLFDDLKSLSEYFEPTNDFKQNVLKQYSKWVIENLKPIMEETHDREEVEKLVKSFLAKNWELVKGSMLCPTAIPNADVTILLCNLAMFVDAQNPLPILMRDLNVEPSSSGFPLLRQCTKKDIDELWGVFKNASKRVSEVLKLEKERIATLEEELTQNMQTPELYSKTIKDIKDFFAARNLEFSETKAEDLSNRLKDYFTELSNKEDETLGILDGDFESTKSNLYLEFEDTGQISIENWERFSKAIKAINQFLLKKYPNIPSLDQANAMGKIQEDNEGQNQQLDIYFSRFVQAFSLEHILKTHIVSDDYASLIPVACLTSDNSEKPKPYADDYSMINPNELARLSEHSDLTRALVLLLEKVSNLEKQQSTNLLTQLKFLCKVFKNEDAHGGRGTGNQVGELAFAPLVAFFDFYGKLSDEKKSQIPVKVREEIEFLQKVSGDFRGDMTGRSETCAGTRRQEIEKAMLGHDVILAGISIDEKESSRQLANQIKAVHESKTDLLNALTNPSIRRGYSNGFDPLGFNKTILQELNIKFEILKLADVQAFNQLDPKDIRELLEDNSDLQQSILSQIKSLDDLIILILEMSEPKLRAFLQDLCSEIKQKYVKNDKDKNALLFIVDQNIGKIKLMMDFFDITFSNIVTFFTPQDKLIVQQLIEGTDFNLNDIEGKTPLMWASAQGYDDIVGTLLINKDIKVNLTDKKGMTALMHASAKGHTNVAVQLLQHEHIEVNTTDNEGRSALMYASANGHTDVAEQLLQHEHIKVNITTKLGFTALMYASANGHTNVIEQLLKFTGIEVNITDNIGMTALMHASARGHANVIEQLRKFQGVDVNITTKLGFTALMFASMNGHTNVVEQLRKFQGVEVNKKGNKRMTALMHASANGHTNVIEQLLKFTGIEVNITDNEGKSALMYAIKSGKAEIIDALLDSTDLSTNSSSVLEMALIKGDVEIIKRLLNHPNITVNFSEFKKEWALYLAIIAGNMDQVHTLLSNTEVDINVKVANEKTLLMLAVNCGHVETIKKLLELGIDVNKKDRDGNTALSLASQKFVQSHQFEEKNKYSKIINILLTHEIIDKTCLDRMDKNSLLILAAKNGHREVVTELLKNTNIDVNLQDYLGKTLLMYAAENGHKEVVTELLKNTNIEVNKKSNDELTALMYAAENGHKEVVTELLKHPNIDVNQQNWYNETALMLAVKCHRLEIVTELLKHPKIDVNKKANHGLTALMYAHHKEFVTELLKHPKIDENQQNSNNETALMLAAKYRHLEIVSVLLNRNITIDEVNFLLTQAAERHNHEIVEELSDYVKINLILKGTNWRDSAQKFRGDDIGNTWRDSFLKFLLSSLEEQKSNSDSKNLNHKLLDKSLKFGFKPKDSKYLNDIYFIGFFTQLAKVNTGNEYSEIMKKMLDSAIKNFKSQTQNPIKDLSFAHECLGLVKGLKLEQHTNLPLVILKCVLAFLVFPVFIYLLATNRLLKSDVESARDKFQGELEKIERRHSPKV